MFVVIEIKLQVVNRILLAAEEEAYLIIYKLELPCHFFIDIVYFVHGPNGAMHALKIGEILVESILHPTLLLLSQSSSLFVPYCLL